MSICSQWHGPAREEPHTASYQASQSDGGGKHDIHEQLLVQMNERGFVHTDCVKTGWTELNYCKPSLKKFQAVLISFASIVQPRQIFNPSDCCQYPHAGGHQI